MTDDPWNDSQLPLSAARHLDGVCCRFEADLQAGKAPAIEAFLDGAAGVARRALLRELLALEVHYRRRQREPAEKDHYQTRFPDERDLVELVFREADSAAGSAGAAVPRLPTFAERRDSPPTYASRPTEYSQGSEGSSPASDLHGPLLDLPAADRRYTTRDLLARGGMGEVFLAEEPVAAYPEGLAARCWRWCKRRRRQLGLATMGAALLVCAALAVVQVQEVRQWRQREQAGRDVAAFHRLADEVCFYAANTDPLTEAAPYYEPQRAVRVADAAFALSDAWGPRLERLPLVDQRPRLRDELYSLSLLVLQARLSDRADASAANSLQAVFHRLPLLRAPARSYYQLLGEFQRRSGKEELAAEADRCAASSAVPVTSLDHFVEGERLRRSAFHGPAEDEEAAGRSRNAERLEAALREYAQALQREPNHYWSHFQRGRCLLALGRNAEAVEALSACVALRPDVPWGYSARGLAAAQGRRYDEALQDVNHALAACPDLLVARLNRGVVYWLMGPSRHDAALADFAAVLAAPPERRLIEAAFYRGQVSLQRGDWQAALADFDRVVEARPDFRAAHRLRARLQLLCGDPKRGLRDLDDYLALGRDAAWRPDGARACYDRGRFLRRLAPEAGARAPALAELAERELRQALEQGSPAAPVCDELGAALELLGRPGDALAIYSRGLQQQPDEVGLRLKRGWLLALHLRDHEQAQAEFGRVVSLQPQNSEALSGLGYVAACRESASDAERYAVQALLFGGGDYLTLHNVAGIYARLYRNTQGRGLAHRETAVDLLARDVELWHRAGGESPSALQLIRADDELRVLGSSPTFQALLQETRP